VLQSETQDGAKRTETTAVVAPMKKPTTDNPGTDGTQIDDEVAGLMTDVTEMAARQTLVRTKHSPTLRLRLAPWPQTTIYEVPRIKVAMEVEVTVVKLEEAEIGAGYFHLLAQAEAWSTMAFRAYAQGLLRRRKTIVGLL
jgi:hypothetical protein